MESPRENLQYVMWYPKEVKDKARQVQIVLEGASHCSKGVKE
jgi:hypothetical protein